MLTAVGVIVITVVIVANASALADILEDAELPAPVVRAWLAGVVLAPGVGAALWFAHRSRIRREGRASSRSNVVYPTGADFTRLHQEIDQYLSQ